MFTGTSGTLALAGDSKIISTYLILEFTYLFTFFVNFFNNIIIPSKINLIIELVLL